MSTPLSFGSSLRPDTVPARRLYITTFLGLCVFTSFCTRIGAHTNAAQESVAPARDTSAVQGQTALGGVRPRFMELAAHCNIKPPVSVELSADWTAAQRGSTLPVSATIILDADASKLRVRFVGRGVFSGLDASYDLSGPWKSGARLTTSHSALGAGPGEGSVEVTAEAVVDAGARLISRRSDLFALFETGAVWGSYSSPTDLHLWRAEALSSHGLMDAAAREKYVERTIRATAIMDTRPRARSLASPHDVQLQQAFATAAASAPTESIPTPSTPGVAAAPATITVAGKVEWTDSAGGKHAVPMARVEIRDSELVGSDLITTVTTDAAGNYSTTFTFDDGLLQGNPDIFVRVLARSTVADIKPDSILGSTYAMDSPVQDEVASGSSLTINLTAGNSADNETVFGVHHALVMIGAYAGGLAGTMPTTIDVRFPTTRHTSLFDSGARQLHILRLDRFDWDVIHHEYGHYFQNVHAFQNNPGGAHSFGDNLASTRGNKSVGIRLAWGEGWPTFFGLAGQAASSAAALSIPNVGDVSYHDTEDATTTLNIETSNGVGEDNEVSVMAALWDLYDTAGDGVDESNFSDRFLFNTFKAAAVTTMGAAWEAVAATQTTQQKTLVGGVLGQAKIAPELLTPADNFSAGAAPPAFTWSPNGGGAPNPLNDFRIRFYRSDFSAIVFEKALGNVTTFTPTAAEWTTILGGGDTIKWVVEGKNTAAPETPGGAVGYYWSRARTLGGLPIIFVIDDTGSMGEEIAGVRNALQAFINQVEARLAPGERPPTIQLITFKDNVTTRITSSDLAAVRASVAGLFASGGNDCPEFSAQALEVAASNVSPGGTILLATDASSQPGVDIGALIARLRAKSVTVNTILSGDCTGIGSSLAPELIAASVPENSADEIACCDPQTDDSAGVPPVLFRSASTNAENPGGFIQKPGADDPPQATIIDPGQPPEDEAGNTALTAMQLTVGDTRTRGLVGLSGDPTDFFAVRLLAGKQYSVRFQLEAGASTTFALLNTNGTTIIQQQTLFSAIPGRFIFAPTVTGDYFVRATASAAAFYLLAVAEDPFGALVTAVQMFSTISAQTGGAFIVRDDVNTGRTVEYEAALLNVMLTTLGPATLFASPDDLQRGTTVTIELVGRGTNWRTGTTAAVSGTGVTVDSVTVLSPSRLRAVVTIAAAATLGFRNVVVTTPLGGASEVVTGFNIVEVVAANPNPAILAVEPSVVNQGDVLSMTVRGINTTWDTSSVLTLGAGVTVQSQTVVSPTLIQASVSVDAAAALGFRTARVASSGGRLDQKVRALFVFSGIAALPELTQVSPNRGERGRELDVQVQGINTNFVNGVTTASFGSGVQVVSTTVLSPTSARVRVAVEPLATLGFRDVTLTTGAEVAVFLAGFFVDEVAESLEVVRGGFVLNRVTQRFVQQLSVRNVSTLPINRVALVLDALSANATLVNANGVTANNPPLGAPYANLDLGADGVLTPQETRTITLDFANPSRGPITYTLRTLRNVDNP